MWEDIVRARKDHRNVPYTASDIGRADPAYRAWVRGEMRSKRFVAFVAEGPEGPLGSGSLWLQPSEPRPGRLAGGVLPQVISMYTAPRFRGRGIATGLVEAQLAWLRASGFDGRVGLHASDAGRPVYERIGFRAGTEMVIDLWARPRPLSGSGYLYTDRWTCPSSSVMRMHSPSHS
jgi:GNAT superfamily N-acetyltransferase